MTVFPAHFFPPSWPKADFFAFVESRENRDNDCASRNPRPVSRSKEMIRDGSNGVIRVRLCPKLGKRLK
ncbi:hypothetical protein Y032_0954g3196 [Ancylostoma ceylanicum]|nr:hypothetical protein Y032_0954g3196 [Ancylostoma ceylanicum]